MLFPAAGVEANPLLPAFAAFLIAFVCSPAGISGALLLLPFQMSILGYAKPGVSATNQIFNIIACPAGVWRFYREGRFLFPLAVFMAIGTLPGVFLGAILRLTWLSTLSRFSIFMACVFIYMSWRLFRRKDGKKRPPANATITNSQANWRGFSFCFMDVRHQVSSSGIMLLSLVIGIVGGAYGIGGGGILAPFLISFFGLPGHAISGACLFTTFLTSIAGAAFFLLLSATGSFPAATPDLLLGIILGIGGMVGMYCGAALQKYLPGRVIRYFLMALMLGLAGHYLLDAF